MPVGLADHVCMNWELLFAGGHGVLTAAELRRAGIEYHQVQQALATQQFEQVSRGRYALPGELNDFGTARALNGMVTGLSALDHWNIWIPKRPEKLQIRVTRHVQRKLLDHPYRRSLSKSVDVRVLRPSIPDHFTQHPRGRGNGRDLRRQPIDDVATALLVAEATCEWDELVAIGDSVLRTMRPTDMLQDLSELGGTKLGRALSRLDARADSGTESLMRVRLQEASIWMEPQVQISRMRVDGLIGTSLIIEADSKEFHASPEQMLADRRRDRVLQSMGYNVLRYMWKEVMFEWERVLREIRYFVDSGLHLQEVLPADDVTDVFAGERSRLIVNEFAVA